MAVPMAVSMSSPAARLQPVRLLRALLREASYLPDAAARSYFRHYVVNRFKAYQPKHNATAPASFDMHALATRRHRSFRRHKLAVIHERSRPLLRKAHKGLNFLRRANQGELPCLQKVLYFAYGRLGRRRHALLRDLLRPDPIMDDGASQRPHVDEAAPLQQLYYSNKRFLQYFDAPRATSTTEYTIHISNRYSRLRNVIKSQYDKGRAVQAQLRAPALKTPINNIWERPMPIKRARNNVRRWYALTLTRLLPPLPAEEWDSINSMIAGNKHISFTKLRTPASQPLTWEESEEQLPSIISQGITLDKPSKADKPAGVQRPHNINTRFMRRLYTKLLALCCKLEYDYKRKIWVVIWGETKKPMKDRVDTLADELLFAGVDLKGSICKTPRSPQVDANT